uniref:Uncharacterized protein n=1 Tax=Timema douglasi TaxID=61478 RepID=A0A7R8VKY8_TIMDO|nr:unnamed protein product [Timema douglasi]
MMPDPEQVLSAQQERNRVQAAARSQEAKERLQQERLQVKEQREATLKRQRATRTIEDLRSAMVASLGHDRAREDTSSDDPDSAPRLGGAPYRCNCRKARTCECVVRRRQARVETKESDRTSPSTSSDRPSSEETSHTVTGIRTQQLIQLLKPEGCVSINKMIGESKQLMGENCPVSSTGDLIDNRLLIETNSATVVGALFHGPPGEGVLTSSVSAAQERGSSVPTVCPPCPWDTDSSSPSTETAEQTRQEQNGRERRQTRGGERDDAYRILEQGRIEDAYRILEQGRVEDAYKILTQEGGIEDAHSIPAQKEKVQDADKILAPKEGPKADSSSKRIGLVHAKKLSQFWLTTPVRSVVYQLKSPAALVSDPQPPKPLRVSEKEGPTPGQDRNEMSQVDSHKRAPCSFSRASNPSEPLATKGGNTSRSSAAKTRAPSKVQLYDHSARYEKLCDTQHRVQRLRADTQPDAEEMARREEGAHQPVMEEGPSRFQALERGHQALAQLRISQDYQHLVDQLALLTKEERKVRSHHTHVDVYLNEERRKERNIRRQKDMDSAFERVYHSSATATGCRCGLARQSDANFEGCRCPERRVPITLDEHRPAYVVESPPKLNVAVCGTRPDVSRSSISPESSIEAARVPHNSESSTWRAHHSSSLLQQLMDRVNIQRSILMEEVREHLAPQRPACPPSKSQEHPSSVTKPTSPSPGDSPPLGTVTHPESVPQTEECVGKTTAREADSETQPRGSPTGDPPQPTNDDNLELREGSTVSVVSEYSLDVSLSAEQSFSELGSSSTSMATSEDIHITVSVREKVGKSYSSQTDQPLGRPQEGKQESSFAEKHKPASTEKRESLSAEKHKPVSTEEHRSSSSEEHKPASSEEHKPVSTEKQRKSVSNKIKIHQKYSKKNENNKKKRKKVLEVSYERHKMMKETRDPPESQETSVEHVTPEGSSVSTVYLSPPHEVVPAQADRVDRLLSEIHKQKEELEQFLDKHSSSNSDETDSTDLRFYISQLLTLSRQSVEDLNVSEVSDTPNIPQTVGSDRLHSDAKSDNTTIKVAPSPEQKPPKRAEPKVSRVAQDKIPTKKLHYRTPSAPVCVSKPLPTPGSTVSTSGTNSVKQPFAREPQPRRAPSTIDACEKVSPSTRQKVPLKPKNCYCPSEPPPTPSSLSALRNGAQGRREPGGNPVISGNFNDSSKKLIDRISSLSEMIEQIRREKQMLLESSSDSQRDSTKYISPPESWVPTVEARPRRPDLCFCPVEDGNLRSEITRPPPSQPVRSNRFGNHIQPHELSTIVEVDTPQSSQLLLAAEESTMVDDNQGKDTADNPARAHGTEDTLREDVGSDDTLPDVMAELMRRQLITSPFLWSEQVRENNPEDQTSSRLFRQQTDPHLFCQQTDACRSHEQTDAHLPHEQTDASRSHEQTDARLPHEQSDACLPHELTDACLPHELTDACLPHELTDACLPHRQSDVCLSHDQTNASLPETSSSRDLSIEQFKEQILQSFIGIGLNPSPQDLDGALKKLGLPLTKKNNKYQIIAADKRPPPRPQSSTKQSQQSLEKPKLSVTESFKRQIMSNFLGIGVEPTTSELESAFRSLGVSWAGTTLRKTKEAEALSPSSGENNSNSLQSNHTENSFDRSLPTSVRGRSTPVSSLTSSSKSAGNNNHTTCVSFPGESDISSVQPATSSNEDQSTLSVQAPNVSLKTPSLNRPAPRRGT